jgi:hypothetical protein
MKTLTATNSRSFADTTIHSAHCRDLRNLILVNAIPSGREHIRTISLSQKYPEILVISVGPSVRVINIERNDQMSQFTPSDKVVSIGCTSHDEQIVCFSSLKGLKDQLHEALQF